jgi:hypothetical protein
MAEAHQHTSTKPAEAKPKPAADPAKTKEAKPVAPRTVAGHAMSAVISLGTDKDGKKYGPDNNPKRAGSAAATRFALYKDGMTVEAALKAGLRSDDIAFDLHETRKFITVK